MLEQFFPVHEVVPTEARGVDTARQTLERIDRVSVGPHTPVLGVIGGGAAFLRENPDRLWLTVGEMGSDGLQESSIGGITDDPDLLKLWRGLLRRTRSGLHKGARIFGPDGASIDAPSHRHTPAAHGFAAAGVPMRAITGGVRYEFDDLQRP